jgi:hypothetical protein
VLQNGGSEIAQPKIDLVSSVVADSPHKVRCCFFSLYFIETALPQFWFNFWWLCKSGNFSLSETKHKCLLVWFLQVKTGIRHVKLMQEELCMISLHVLLFQSCHISRVSLFKKEKVDRH